MRAIYIAAAAGLTACAHFWTPAPDVPQPLKATDKRHVITGTWELTLAVDSVGSLRSEGALRDTLPQVRVACFRIAESLASPRRSYLRATLQPSFGHMLGSLYRTPSPVPPQANPPGSSEEVTAAKHRAEESSTWPPSWGGHAIDVQRRNDRWSITLTPGVSDYYVGLSGQLSGDSLAGTWLEASQGQTVSVGHFTMRQLDSPSPRPNPSLQLPGRPSTGAPCNARRSQANSEH